jgi:hypothetical protein
MSRIARARVLLSGRWLTWQEFYETLQTPEVKSDVARKTTPIATAAGALGITTRLGCGQPPAEPQMCLPPDGVRRHVGGPLRHGTLKMLFMKSHGCGSMARSLFGTNGIR